MHSRKCQHVRPWARALDLNGWLVIYDIWWGYKQMMDSCGAGFEHCSLLHVLWSPSQGSWWGKIYIWMATFIVFTTCNPLFAWLSIIHSLQHLNDTDMSTDSAAAYYWSLCIYHNNDHEKHCHYATLKYYFKEIYNA